MVITNTPGYEAKGAKIFASIEQAIAAASTEKVFCIGGASIWYHAMHIADEALITVVKRSYPINPGTTHCAPELINPSSKWPSFRFNDMKMNKDAEGETPGFSIAHWVRNKTLP
jgi:dihydrofolate reductase